MKIFDFFKKAAKPKGRIKEGKMSLHGPTFFEGLTEPITNPIALDEHEWRRKLKTSRGDSKFSIKYYGQLHHKYPTLICGTEFAPALVIAVDDATGQEITIFDGCRYGWNALFCDSYTVDQIENRPTTNFYKDTWGNSTFDILITVFDGLEEEDFIDMIDDNGCVELADGSKLKAEIARRNCFDAMQIFAINDKGKEIEIICEELA